MVSKLFTRRLWLVSLFLLAGCATRPPVSEPVSEAAWLAHQALLETLTDWQARGRVAVRTGEDGWNAHFDWHQQGQDYLIRLRGPFGQGAVELQGNGRGVWLKRADQPAVFALDPETLLEQQTGWQLPVAGLSSWLRGLPVAELDGDLHWDGQGRLLQLRQNGWQIDYSRYQEQGNLQLPQKFKLERDTVKVRFVIDDWQLS
jgi:outer membrane lipoprotein LolB